MMFNVFWRILCIKCLDFSMRTLKFLRRQGINTVEEFVKCNLDEFIISSDFTVVRNYNKLIKPELVEKKENCENIIKKYEIIPYEMFEDFRYYKIKDIDRILLY